MRRPTPDRRPGVPPQSLHPHNGDETGRGYSRACHPRILEHAWPQCAVRVGPVRRGTVAMLTMTPPTTGCQYGPYVAGPASQRDTRRRPSLPQSAWDVAGPRQPATSLPRSMCTIKETRRGKATVKPATPESRSTHGHSAPYGSAIPRPARHCSHVDHDATHDGLSVRPAGGGPLQPERRSKAVKPPYSRPGV